jgi:hypothetical protein
MEKEEERAKERKEMRARTNMGPTRRAGGGEMGKMEGKKTRRRNEPHRLPRLQWQLWAIIRSQLS